MNAIEKLFEDLATKESQYAYYVSKKDAPQADKYNREAHEAAVKLAAALVEEYVITASELADWLGRQNA